ncbi:MAG TPA: PAS domain S-box protein [Xanthobacteraceae bacterium]|nr:PAS domain S-box protein [Xanthobacteraceae bacterium]
MARSSIRALDDTRRLQLLIDGITDYAVYLIDQDGRVASWNTGARRLKGYDASEIIGKPYATFFTPEDRERGLPDLALETAAASGRWEQEGWRVRKDGTRFWAMAVLDAVYQDGALIGFAKVTRDITERLESRERLNTSESRFRQLIDAVVDYAVFQLDAEGHVLTWNTGAERIKGYAASEIIGQHFSRFYTEEDRHDGMPQKVLATAAAEGRFEAEGWRVRKDGSKFRASVVIDPIRNERGELLGFAKVTRDVTERYEAQRVLKETQEQLAASQKMEAVGQLSGGIAHDFNNLLMIVLGNLETIERYAKTLPGPHPNLRRAVGNALRGANRAAALTARLLAFSRRQALSPRPLDLNKFLSGAADFMQRSLGEAVEIQAVGSAGLWQIEADPTYLETALLNLAINARDAMPRGGKITIEAANVFADEEYCRVNPEISPGPYVAICVSDTGCGMPPDVLSRAFEPFFTTKELGQGTGLGLSQVYGFVKQSGGHVKIYSEVDQGTTIKIYLPRYLGKDEPDSVEDDKLESGEENSEIILVVEDDDDLRGYIAGVLRGLGYRVRAVANAAAAIPILEQKDQPIDLLLTDVVMPGRNGRELGQYSRTLRPGLPILYMTGYSRNAVVHHGRLDEGVDLLQKPVGQQLLATRVRDLLDRAQGGKERPQDSRNA